jgi:hypothetical protein
MNQKELDQAYPYIRKWGQELRSDPEYITRQQEKALADKAPANAIYKRDSVGQDGQWETTDGIRNLEMRRRWGLPWREQDERREKCNRLRDELREVTAHDDPDLLLRLIETAKREGGTPCA